LVESNAPQTVSFHTVETNKQYQCGECGRIRTYSTITAPILQTGTTTNVESHSNLAGATGFEPVNTRLTVEAITTLVTRQ
jgi:hypothetical protein